MNVFVMGTGRCGTTTFAKACNCFKGFTSKHESKVKNNDLVYPNNHIESDPHLFWHLPNLVSKYPDALYIHIIRERDACIRSLSKRPSLYSYAYITELSKRKKTDLNKIAERFYDFVTGCLCSFFKGNGHLDYMEIDLPPTKDQWREFHEKIGSPNGYKESLKHWNRRYNRS